MALVGIAGVEHCNLGANEVTLNYGTLQNFLIKRNKAKGKTWSACAMLYQLSYFPRENLSIGGKAGLEPATLSL
jgi:hypothetical protein